MLNLADLHDQIMTVCPIVSIIAPTVDSTTWYIDYDETATDEQKAAAEEMFTSYKQAFVLRSNE